MLTSKTMSTKTNYTIVSSESGLVLHTMDNLLMGIESFEKHHWMHISTHYKNCLLT